MTILFLKEFHNKVPSFFSSNKSECGITFLIKFRHNPLSKRYHSNSSQTQIHSINIFFGPSFFASCEAVEKFFNPSDVFLTISILSKIQNCYPFLFTVYTWLKQNEKTLPFSPNSQKYLLSMYLLKQFNYSYKDPISQLIQYYRHNSCMI